MYEYDVDFGDVLDIHNKPIGVVRVKANNRNHAYDEAFKKITLAVSITKTKLRQEVSIHKCIRDVITNDVSQPFLVNVLIHDLDKLINKLTLLEPKTKRIRVINLLLDIRKIIK
jgi:hypothetical protein